MSLKVDIFGIGSVVVDNSDCDHFQGAQYPGNKAYNVPRAPPTPALNKEKRRQYGLCSQGDYSIDAGIYLPIQLCITISGFLFFPMFAKTASCSSSSQYGAFVRSRFSIHSTEYLMSSNLPCIIQLFSKAFQTIDAELRNNNSGLSALWAWFQWTGKGLGWVQQLFAWLNLIGMELLADMKRAELGSVGCALNK